MKVNFTLVEEWFIQKLLFGALESKEGIFVSNENSM